MEALYGNCIQSWEHRLAGKYSSRSAEEPDWGLDWLTDSHQVPDSARRLEELAEQAVSNSDSFFGYKTPAEFQLRDQSLTFESPVQSPYPDNNIVHAQLFEARNAGGRAVLVLPPWNSTRHDLNTLCALLNRCGLTALRMSLAYHEPRTPPGSNLSDYHVSSNLGRTLHAVRQSVIDARACLDWLQSQGYRRLAILGASLGACIAFLTVAHDARIQVCALNHVAMNFADVIWTGLPTRYLRESLSRVTTQHALRRFWLPISASAYIPRLSGRGLKLQIISARWDTTFLPKYTLEMVAQIRQLDVACDIRSLPCGHFTSGRFPFSVVNGWMMCRFLAKSL